MACSTHSGHGRTRVSYLEHLEQHVEKPWAVVSEPLLVLEPDLHQPLVAGTRHLAELNRPFCHRQSSVGSPVKRHVQPLVGAHHQAELNSEADIVGKEVSGVDHSLVLAVQLQCVGLRCEAFISGNGRRRAPRSHLRSGLLAVEAASGDRSRASHSTCRTKPGRGGK